MSPSREENGQGQAPGGERATTISRDSFRHSSGRSGRAEIADASGRERLESPSRIAMRPMAGTAGLRDLLDPRLRRDT